MWEDNKLVEKWEPVLDGVEDDFIRRTTAQLLENQAKSILSERMDEAASYGDATTVGKLGTFQKFAFPLVRRVYPELIANKLVGVQPMQGPVSQIFYLGHTRSQGANSIDQTVYSKFNLTYRGAVTSSVGTVSGHGTAEGQNQATISAAWTSPESGNSSGLDGDDAISGFDLSNVLMKSDAMPSGGAGYREGMGGHPSATYGGKVASFPDPKTILGYSVSAGERLKGNEIPELSFHIEQQAVVARTRKMRALWTLEASQDLKAYHDLDLERELTGLLSQELSLEIDRELIEDLRMIAYDVPNIAAPGLGGWERDTLANANPNSFAAQGGLGPFEGSDFTPVAFTYDFTGVGTSDGATEIGSDPAGTDSNVFVIDFTASSLDFAPQHMGHVYANLLAVLNLASQDIYKTTHRGPGSWILTSPLVASMLESAAKLEGGMAGADKPTNMGGTKVEYKGKFAGKYDLYVDPLFPEDEIMMGYKGANAMDAGFCYCPYIPLQQIPTIVDPETFQPRKGILTRYGKAAVQPASRFYRIIRIIGPTANYLFTPFAKNTSNNANSMEAIA